MYHGCGREQLKAMVGLEVLKDECWALVTPLTHSFVFVIGESCVAEKIILLITF